MVRRLLAVEGDALLGDSELLGVEFAKGPVLAAGNQVDAPWLDRSLARRVVAEYLQRTIGAAPLSSAERGSTS